VAYTKCENGGPGINISDVDFQKMFNHYLQDRIANLVTAARL